MSQARVSVVESFAVPPERLWEAICDHEAMGECLGLRAEVVAGPRDGGLGTVRRMSVRGLTFDEEVTYADPPRRMVYRITRGLPLLRFHRGEMLIEPWGQTGSQLTWDILIDSIVPGVARGIAAGLRPAVRRALGELRARLSQ